MAEELQILPADAITAMVAGRLFSSWISDGGRSVGYATTDIIENPAYILESLHRDVLGIAGAYIDTPSIDGVGNTTNGRRDDWKFARSLHEIQDSLDVCHEIAYESGCLVVNNAQGKLRMLALANYTPSITLDNGDIVEEDGKPIARALQTPVSLVRNQFYLKYHLNYASGNYDRMKFVTESEDNLSDGTRSNADGNGATYQALCSGSQTKYNIVRDFQYSAGWIRDDATAELFIKFLANLLALRRWKVKARTWLNSTTRQLEYGDPLLWNIPLLPASVNSTRVFFAGRIVDGVLRRKGQFDIETTMIPQVI